MAELSLTRDQRRRLLAGETPRIAGEGQAPVEPGFTFHLLADVTLTVLSIRTPKGGGWSLQYEVRDNRDHPRLIRRTPAINAADFKAVRRSFDRYGYPTDPTPDVIAEAAEESAYTGAQGSAVEDAGEAVDPATQRRFTEQAHLTGDQRAMLHQLRRERHALEQRLRQAREDARLKGVDISSPERVIERQIKAIERRVYEGKKAA